MLDRRLNVAPMMDWTDRHCRFFHRILAPDALLYTEMVTTGALLHGDRARHLDFSPEEHPVALQLGGSDPDELARCAALGAAWGYAEINLNCGCPSPRVQKGRFGACLMAEPALVAACVRAMHGATDRPVTVKTRIGIDARDSYGFFRDFAGAVIEAGAEALIVHARKAWLSGLSPRENREIPPLDYAVPARLKAEFPQTLIVLNGGLKGMADALPQLRQGGGPFDGVMLGRAACAEPWVLAELQLAMFGRAGAATPEAAVAALAAYAERAVAAGAPLKAITRHALGLFTGVKGARAWRRVLSEDAARHPGPPAALFARALACLDRSPDVSLAA